MTTNSILSFELFPPKTENGFDKLKTTVTELNRLQPAYFSVTYGAGGSTQEKTFATVDWLREQSIDTAPHLSCVGADKQEILQILQRYREQGINRIVALRGDLPSGAGLGGLAELNYANELVSFIRDSFARAFHIEVAAYPEFHPQAASAEIDLNNFQRENEVGEMKLSDIRRSVLMNYLRSVFALSEEQVFELFVRHAVGVFRCIVFSDSDIGLTILEVHFIV